MAAGRFEIFSTEYFGPNMGKNGPKLAQKWAKLQDVADGCVFCDKKVGVGVFHGVDDDPGGISVRKSIKTPKNAKNRKCAYKLETHSGWD